MSSPNRQRRRHRPCQPTQDARLNLYKFLACDAGWVSCAGEGAGDEHPAASATGLGFVNTMTGWTADGHRHGRATDARRATARKRLRRALGGGVTGAILLAPIALAQAASAQTASPPPNSLVVDPQQGATPRPLQPQPPLSLPPPDPASPVIAPAPSVTEPPVILPIAPTVTVTRATPAGPSGPSDPSPFQLPEGSAQGLPMPSGDPLRIDPATDPILQIARTASSPDAFNRAIAAAVARNPALDEVNAQVDEAEAARQEARARRLPTADLSISSFRIITRAFSNDPRNVLERSRPNKRTDGLARIQQPVFDWGASGNRIRASEARLEAARADIEDAGSQVALRAVSVWYSVYGYRVLLRLSDAFLVTQRALRASVEDRVRQGAAAPADVAQVDSYIASADAQRADFKRLLVSAEAQYTAVVGVAPPADLERAPAPSLDGVVLRNLPVDTNKLPVVRAARFGVDAARRDARALKGERLPQLGASLDAGRYGIIENRRDYDVRGSLTLSMRLGGGVGARINQAEARVARAGARLRQAEIDTQRDAEIALSDVQALEEARAALESNYIASRRSRDVLAERFRVSRGTVFDLLGAQSNYFGVTARYLQSMIELDSARYVLLARTARLLPALGIDPATLETR